MEDTRGKAKSLFKKLNPFSTTSRFKGEGHTLGTSNSAAAPAPRNPPAGQQQQEEWRRLQQERWESEMQKKAASKGKKVSESAQKVGSRKQEVVEKVSAPQEPKVTPKPAEAPRQLQVKLPYSSPAPPFPEEGQSFQQLDVDKEEVETQVVTFLSHGASEAATDVLVRLLKNIAREPQNDKFRRIRMANPKIQETIGSAVGSTELLEFFGFRLVAEEGETWSIMDVPTPERVALLKEAASMMETQLRMATQGTTAVASDKGAPPSAADRELRVFFCSPDTATVRADLPDSFYELSVQEVKSQAALTRRKVEDSKLIVPKSFREKQALAQRRKYKFGIIRVQFPDGVVLQGVFLPTERTSAIYAFVKSALKEDVDFELIDPVNSKDKVVSCEADSLRLDQAGLLPSAVLKFQTSAASTFSGLRNEHLARMEPLTPNPF